MALSNPPREARGVWSASEHERFLQAILLYPQGPWALVTAHIGTRSAKQVQTHAQKYQHKLKRHQRGLRKWKTKSKRPEHRVDTSTANQLMHTKNWIPRRKCDSVIPSPNQSRETAWKYNGDSDSSARSEMDTIVETIVPVPFQALCFAPLSSEVVGRVNVSEEHDLFEAFEAIMNWAPPGGTCVV